MNDTSIAEKDYFVAWILFFLCATVAGALAGAIFGGIAGFMLGASGVTDATTLQIAGGIMGFIVGLPISYLCFRFFVGKFIVKKLLDGIRTVETF
ncbi:MAG: hypothetical protein GY719_33705 [bacterium]|nr:hypothetical protein [bacterium]